jgi:hypothetical protein
LAAAQIKLCRTGERFADRDQGILRLGRDQKHQDLQFVLGCRNRRQVFVLRVRQIRDHDEKLRMLFPRLRN